MDVFALMMGTTNCSPSFYTRRAVLFATCIGSPRVGKITIEMTGVCKGSVSERAYGVWQNYYYGD
jgi:hypothetical protein